MMVFLGAVAGAVVLLDQLTKFLIMRSFSEGRVFPPGGAVGFCFTINRGGLFGSFARTRWGPIVFPLIAFIAIVLILIYIKRVREKNAWMRWGFALVLGGAVGNLIDRLRPETGHGVIDFIKLWIWPLFNVADMCICTGTGLLLLDLSFRREPGAQIPFAGESAGEGSGIQGAETNPGTGKVADP